MPIPNWLRNRISGTVGTIVLIALIATPFTLSFDWIVRAMALPISQTSAALVKFTMVGITYWAVTSFMGAPFVGGGGVQRPPLSGDCGRPTTKEGA